MIKQMDGIREGRCIDGDSGYDNPSGDTHVFPCVHRWMQFFSFGDGRLAPQGSIFFTMPQHLVESVHRLGHEQIPYMCLGVWGRGDADEEDWDKDDDEEEDVAETEVAEVEEDNDDAEDSGGATRSGDEADAPATCALSEWDPLKEWNGEQIYTTQCTNTGAVIEWLFVPYIVEDENRGPLIVSSDNNASTEGKDESTNWLLDEESRRAEAEALES